MLRRRRLDTHFTHIPTWKTWVSSRHVNDVRRILQTTESHMKFHIRTWFSPRALLSNSRFILFANEIHAVDYFFDNNLTILTLSGVHSSSTAIIKYSELMVKSVTMGTYVPFARNKRVISCWIFCKCYKIRWQRPKLAFVTFYFTLILVSARARTMEAIAPTLPVHQGWKLRDAISNLSGAIIPWRNPPVIEEDNVYEALRSQWSSRYAYVLCETRYRARVARICT